MQYYFCPRSILVINVCITHIDSPIIFNILLRLKRKIKLDICVKFSPIALTALECSVGQGHHGQEVFIIIIIPLSFALVFYYYLLAVSICFAFSLLSFACLYLYVLPLVCYYFACLYQYVMPLVLLLFPCLYLWV